MRRGALYVYLLDEYQLLIVGNDVSNDSTFFNSEIVSIKPAD